MELTQSTIDKTKTYFDSVKAKYQNLTFFALIQRVENETWDVVIAGDGLKKENSFTDLASILSTTFLRNELVLFSSLVVLDSLTNKFVGEIRGSIIVDGSYVLIENTRINLVVIKKAYVFYCKSIG